MSDCATVETSPCLVMASRPCAGTVALRPVNWSVKLRSSYKPPTLFREIHLYTKIKHEKNGTNTKKSFKQLLNQTKTSCFQTRRVGAQPFFWSPCNVFFCRSKVRCAGASGWCVGVAWSIHPPWASPGRTSGGVQNRQRPCQFEKYWDDFQHSKYMSNVWDDFNLKYLGWLHLFVQIYLLASFNQKINTYSDWDQKMNVQSPNVTNVSSVSPFLERPPQLHGLQSLGGDRRLDPEDVLQNWLKCQCFKSRWFFFQRAMQCRFMASAWQQPNTPEYWLFLFGV